MEVIIGTKSKSNGSEIEKIMVKDFNILEMAQDDQF